MSNHEVERKISIIAESLEIMGLKLIAAFVRKAKPEEIDGYAELTKVEAKKRNEFFIAEKMRSI